MNPITSQGKNSANILARPLKASLRIGGRPGNGSRSLSMAHIAGQPAPEAEELPRPLPSPEPLIPRGTVGSDSHLGLSVSCPGRWEETHA